MPILCNFSVDAMEAMDAMDDVNMNNIEDFFGNDWESKFNATCSGL